jgi:hypothetical protein
MRLSYSSVVALVVSFAIAGGLAAFLLATPDEGRRPSGDGLGFARFNEGEVLGDLRNAEEYHRARHRDAIVARAAGRNAAAWLRAVAGSGAEATAMPKAVTVSANAMPFVRWADDLPRASWTASVTGVQVADQDDPAAPRQYVATGVVEVELASAAARTRRQRVSVSMTIEAGSGSSTSVVPRTWTIRALEATGDAHFLRAYGDPIIERRGTTVDVVAPNSERLLARRIADDVARQLPALSNRYRSIAAPGVVAVWVLPNATRSRRVLDRAAPVGTTGAAPAQLHGAAWMDPGGDLVIDASRMRRLASEGQVLAVRHALAHSVTRRAADTAPAVLEEGIALYEAARAATPTEPFAGTDLAPLVRAFGGATSGLAQLLVASPKLPLDTGVASTDEPAALATVAWIEDVHGHDALVRLVASIDRGTEPARALHDVLELDARGVEQAVARWTRTQGQDEDTTTGADTPEGDPGAPTDQEQDQ